MIVRDAMIKDVKAIHRLISSYAELDRMLFASMSYIYENLQIFQVAELDGRIVGCGALKVLWEDLAEIKSLAVEEACFGRGIGRKLVESCMDKARHLGLKKVFILTLEPGFFEKIGFSLADRQKMPMKVWSDCTQCSKQDHCDEIAMDCEL